MTISASLQERYSNEVDVDWWESIVLSHPLFPQTYYLTSHFEQQQGSVDGVTRTFIPVPFKFLWPDRSEAGRGDMSLSIGNVSQDLTAALEAAIEDPTERIAVEFNTYLEGSTTPQYTPSIKLSLTDVALTELSVSGVATHADTLNAPFPRVLYRIDQFPGLARR